MVTTDERSQYPHDDAQEHDGDSFEALLRYICDRVAPPGCENGRSLLSVVARCIETHDCLDDPALTPQLKSLVEESAKLLQVAETHFAVDGIVFGWDGKALRAQGVQCHMACGVKTGIVAAVEAGGPEARGSLFLPHLIQTAKRHFPEAREMTAGQAYLSKANFEAAAEMGFDLYIPFKANSTPSCERRDRAWDEALHFYRHEHEEFQRRYRPHYAVEDVMDAVETRTGDCASSCACAGTAQLNAALIRAVVHNLHIVVELKRRDAAA